MTIPDTITHQLATQRAHDLRIEAREHRLAAASMRASTAGSVHHPGLRPLSARLLLRLARRLDAPTVTAVAGASPRRS